MVFKMTARSEKLFMLVRPDYRGTSTLPETCHMSHPLGNLDNTLELLLRYLRRFSNIHFNHRSKHDITQLANPSKASGFYQS